MKKIFNTSFPHPSGYKLPPVSSSARTAYSGSILKCLAGITIGMLVATSSFANPTGAQIANGQVQFNHPDPSTLNITNSNGAIINWQDFSIQQNEITRFIQGSANSAILNRVTSQNPSNILGQLLSNGRVFVINPNGIVFGQNSVVDTAALIASTLDMKDEDFINGNLKFQGENAGTIQNMGYIKTGANGDIFLIAPNIENSGIIETQGGEIILAAGESITIASLDSDHIVFDIQAPDNEVVNLGQIITNGGAAEMFAGTIKHSGSINADSIGINTSGNIVLSASRSITLENGSTLTASGGENAEGGGIKLIAHVRSGDEPAVIYQHGNIDVSGTVGGTIELVADDILQAGNLYAESVQIGGSINVNASGQIIALAAAKVSANSQTGTGGKIKINADESLITSSSYFATGIKGGQVQLLGDDVKVAGASIDVSGIEGGGNINVGGGYQGNDENIRNAARTLVTSDASFIADAIEKGDGGQVIVWAEGETFFTGSIFSKGGADSGNGGFVEVSGKEVLKYGGSVDLTAPAGELGALLLDPKNISVSGSGGATVSAFELISPNNATSNFFGQDINNSEPVVELNNGNLVIIDTESDFGFSNAGAVYIFNPTGTSLLGTIVGSAISDRVGNGGVTLLANGKFTISSPDIDLNLADDGAVSLHDATGAFVNGAGGYGAYTTLNSLYGDTAGDKISADGVFALSDGDYVVSSLDWHTDKGAVTYGNDTTGITGAVTTANSITGTLSGSNMVNTTDGIIELTNGNYVIRGSSYRTANNTSGANRGSVALIDGTDGSYIATGLYGALSTSNALRGAGFDDVGNGGVVALANGNYVVTSYNWDNNSSSSIRYGAVSLMDGTTGQFVNGGGLTGINNTNSLVGTTTGDKVGFSGVTELGNGNYVVASFLWNRSTGVVSQMNGTTGQFVVGGGVSGITTSNSITGGITASDETGRDLIVLTGSNNYVIGSPDAGAATLIDGATGQFMLGGGVGVISAGNSFLMDNDYDPNVGDFGYEALVALNNGNYLFSNPKNSDASLIGRVVLMNGATGAEINRVNGYDDNIQLGDAGTFELANGNYIIFTDDYDDQYSSSSDSLGTILVNGTTGLAIGNGLDYFAGESFSDAELTILSNSNYVVSYGSDDTNALSNNGTVRLFSGTTGTEIARIDGDDGNDFIGSCNQSSNCTFEVDSNYFAFLSVNDDVGGTADVGSVIVVDSTTGVEVDRFTHATPTASESFGDEGYIKLSNGSFVVRSKLINSNEGRMHIVTVGSSAATNLAFADTPAADATISASSIKAALEVGNLILQSNNDFILDAGNDILVSNAGAGGSLTIKVGRSVILNSNIVTDNGNLTIIGNETLANGVSTADRDAGAAVITMAPGVMIDAGTGNVLIDLRDGAGRTGSQALTGIITLTNINANTLSLAGGVFDGTGAINASGTININNGSTLNMIGGTLNSSSTLNNNGLFQLQTGTVSLAGGGTHSGDFSTSAGSVLQFNGGTHTFNSGSDTSGAGDIAFTNGTATYNSGSTYTISGDTGINGGDAIFNIDAVTNTLTHASGLFGGGSSGSITTSTWMPTSGVTLSDIALILAANGNNTLTSTIINSSGTASITNQGTLTLDNSTINPTLTSQGTLNIKTGTSNTVAGTLNITGGTLTGGGTLVGDVNNTGGTLATGDSPGTLTITGNYVQGAGGIFQAELAGAATAGTDYDLLSVSGTATLDGILDIQLFGAYTGNEGDQFDIISSTDVINDFATVNAPTGLLFTASADTPSTGIYQLEIPAPVVVVTTPPPTPTPDEELIDIGTDQLIVLNEYQDRTVVQIVDTDSDDENEEKRELICR